MTKLKTHKGSKKRFRSTASGKLRRTQAGKKHLNYDKTSKRKRQLRRPVAQTGKIADKYVLLLGHNKRLQKPGSQQEPGAESESE